MKTSMAEKAAGDSMRAMTQVIVSRFTCVLRSSSGTQISDSNAVPGAANVPLTFHGRPSNHSSAPTPSSLAGIFIFAGARRPMRTSPGPGALPETMSTWWCTGNAAGATPRIRVRPCAPPLSSGPRRTVAAWWISGESRGTPATRRMPFTEASMMDGSAARISDCSMKSSEPVPSTMMLAGCPVAESDLRNDSTKDPIRMTRKTTAAAPSVVSSVRTGLRPALRTGYSNGRRVMCVAAPP